MGNRPARHGRKHLAFATKFTKIRRRELTWMDRMDRMDRMGGAATPPPSLLRALREEKSPPRTRAAG